MLFGATSNEFLSVIYEYSLGTNKWKKWDKEILIKRKFCGAILTWDEKYVIIAGGNESDEISVLDIDNQCLKISDIKCPKAGPNLISKTVTGNQVRGNCLVHGYVKMTKELEIPMEIIDLIAVYYPIEMMHWIKWTGSQIVC